MNFVDYGNTLENGKDVLTNLIKTGKVTWVMNDESKAAFTYN